MNLIGLKFKIIALAAESQIVRREAHKHKRIFNEMSIRQRLAAGGLTDKQMVRIIRKALGKHRAVPDNPDLGDYPNSLNLKRAGFEVMGNDTHGAPPPWRYVPNPAARVPEAAWLVQKQNLVQGLQEHRRHTIRPMARAAQLAYAFLRNRHYCRAEFLEEGRNVPIIPGRHQKPNWDLVWKFVEKYAAEVGLVLTKEQTQVIRSRFDNWRKEATAYRAVLGIVDKEDEKEKDARESGAFI